MPDDTDQARYEPAYQPRGALPPAELVHAPLQFSVRSLLIAQTVCAVLLALLIVLGIWGALAALVATVVLAAVKVRPERVAGKRLIVDVSGGIVLPLLCVGYAPGLAVARDGSGAWVCLLVGYQILLMAAWQLAGRLTPRFNGFFVGGLSIGVVAATLIGLTLLPLAVIGTLMLGLGLLGFTPFLTAVVFARNARRAWREARPRNEGMFGWLVLAGVIAAVAVPWAICPAVAALVTQAIYLANRVLSTMSPLGNPFPI